MITKIQSDFDEFPLREINKIEFRSLPDHFVFRYTQEDLLNKIEITKYLKTCGFSSTYEGEISYSINIPSNDVFRTICAASINDNIFFVTPCLRKETFQCFLNMFYVIIDNSDNTNFIFHIIYF